MDSVASDKQWRKMRVRIEHGTLLRADRYESVRRKGVFVVQNPVHFALADIANARLSPDQLAEIDPMRSLLDRGIEVAIGSDSVVAPGNPYLDIFFALIQPTRPSEALTVEQAVIAYTRTAAAAEFQEQWKGTLEPGKAADLTVLSRDIFSMPVNDIPLTEAELTMVDGRIVFDAGRLTRAVNRKPGAPDVWSGARYPITWVRCCYVHCPILPRALPSSRAGSSRSGAGRTASSGGARAMLSSVPARTRCRSAPPGAGSSIAT